MEITRRSFLKGLVALSASAAIPIELVKAAELVYSDDTILQTPPAYILIDRKMVTFYGLTISQPIREHQTIWMPSHKIPGVFTPIGQMESPAKVFSEIDIEFLGDYLDKFFYHLDRFDFEIVYEKIPYTIKGRGYAKSITVDGLITSSNDPGFSIFSFEADIYDYVN